MPPRTPRSLILVLSAVMALAGAAVRAQAPESDAGIRETVLPNGLRVLTRPVRTAPVVSFSVWYRVGSRNEHTGITGVSHLLEHLLFKGTKKYGLGEISRTLFVNGASFNASTYYDWTNYYATLSSDRLELAMQIEADRMVNSRIDKADLDSEMSVVRSELEGGENNPSRLLYQAVAAAAFHAHPYQWPVIGWRTDVENVPRDAIYDYYKKFYGPNNATVVIVGDFDTERALSLVRKHFGRLKPIPEPPTVYTQEPPQRGERRVTIRRAGALAMTALAYKAPPPRDADHLAMDILSVALGSGRASRLYRALVETQLATEVDSGNPSLKDPFLFTVEATARPGVTAERLETALLAEVERARDVPLTPEEMTRARNIIESQFILQNDSVSSLAQQIGYWAMTEDWRYLTTYLQRIRSLTAADVQKAARKYLVPESRTVGHFIPTAQGAPAAPPPREASARVEKPRRGDRPVPLPRPSGATSRRPAAARFRLENGISVVVQENPANPTFALRGSLLAGSVSEPGNRPALAQITAGMLSRGTEKRSAQEFAAELEGAGASLSASAGQLYTSLSARGRSRDFERVMDLMAEMLRQPAFPAAELERARGQLLAQLDQAADDPDSLAARAFERAVYPEGSPLRPHTLEETRQAVSSLTRDDVYQFYRGQYGPEGMILVVTGDVRADAVRRALEARLGSWARNPTAKPIPALDVPLQARPVKEAIEVPDKSETAILWGHAGLLRRSDPDFYAAQVLNLILGGGGALNSRLGNVIRDEQGLAYGVFSFFESDLFPGPFQVSLGTNPANAAKAVASLEAEIRRIREEGVTQREVAESVAYLTGSFPVRLETNTGMANVLWAMEFYRLGPDYIDRYGEYYGAVTVAQVNEAARKHLHPDRATLVIAGTNAKSP